MDIQKIISSIEKEYRNSQNNLGWRLLSSPARVMYDAQIAFLGINPGGTVVPKEHGEFSTENGSAYEIENWSNSSAAGESHLQRQVQALFARLSVDAVDVLAGNLIPFRSPAYKDLKNSERALEFGTNLWAEIFDLAQPKIIICMGKPTREALLKLLNVKRIEHVPVNWGPYDAIRGTFKRNDYSGVFIGLPHLSHFPIMNREESQAPLDYLFRDCGNYGQKWRH